MLHGCMTTGFHITRHSSRFFVRLFVHCTRPSPSFETKQFFENKKLATKWSLLYTSLHIINIQWISVFTGNIQGEYIYLAIIAI